MAEQPTFEQHKFLYILEGHPVYADEVPPTLLSRIVVIEDNSVLMGLESQALSP